MPDVCLNGACHCSAVLFRVRLPDGLSSARRCNCSYCTMRGAVAVSTRLEEFILLQGEEQLSCYTFNTRQAKHYFCKVCGIYTHHQRRSRPTEYGVNLACLEGHSPFDLPEVPVLNGRDHPRDGNPHRNPVFGTLLFRRSEG